MFGKFDASPRESDARNMSVAWKVRDEVQREHYGHALSVADPSVKGKGCSAFLRGVQRCRRALMYIEAGDHEPLDSILQDSVHLSRPTPSPGRTRGSATRDGAAAACDVSP